MNLLVEHSKDNYNAMFHNPRYHRYKNTSVFYSKYNSDNSMKREM